jgi:transcriptional regulator with XRE-family HTH domain
MHHARACRTLHGGARVRARKPPFALDEFTDLFSARLREAVGERSHRSVADKAGLSHTTIARLLAGETAPNVATIWALEQALAADLWPRRIDK